MSGSGWTNILQTPQLATNPNFPSNMLKMFQLQQNLVLIQSLNLQRQEQTGELLQENKKNWITWLVLRLTHTVTHTSRSLLSQQTSVLSVRELRCVSSVCPKDTKIRTKWAGEGDTVGHLFCSRHEMSSFWDRFIHGLARPQWEAKLWSSFAKACVIFFSFQRFNSQEI